MAWIRSDDDGVNSAFCATGVIIVILILMYFTMLLYHLSILSYSQNAKFLSQIFTLIVFELTEVLYACVYVHACMRFSMLLLHHITDVNE
jgi:hypothetical protein